MFRSVLTLNSRMLCRKKKRRNDEEEEDKNNDVTDSCWSILYSSIYPPSSLRFHSVNVNYYYCFWCYCCWRIEQFIHSRQVVLTRNDFWEVVKVQQRNGNGNQFMQRHRELVRLIHTILISADPLTVRFGNCTIRSGIPKHCLDILSSLLSQIMSSKKNWAHEWILISTCCELFITFRLASQFCHFSVISRAPNLSRQQTIIVCQTMDQNLKRWDESHNETSYNWKPLNKPND